MRIFQSSITTKTIQELRERKPEIKINALRSYRTDGPETLRLLESNLVHKDMIILDSGVWAKNKGTLKHKSTVKTYGGFVRGNGKRFKFYFNYDEVFRDEGTTEFDDKAIATNIQNQRILEGMGLSQYQLSTTLMIQNLIIILIEHLDMNTLP